MALDCAYRRGPSRSRPLVRLHRPLPYHTIPYHTIPGGWFISDDPLDYDQFSSEGCGGVIKPCPLAARICCTFRPTTFSSVPPYHTSFSTVICGHWCAFTDLYHTILYIFKIQLRMVTLDARGYLAWTLLGIIFFLHYIQSSVLPPFWVHLCTSVRTFLSRRRMMLVDIWLDILSSVLGLDFIIIGYYFLSSIIIFKVQCSNGEPEPSQASACEGATPLSPSPFKVQH